MIQPRQMELYTNVHRSFLHNILEAHQRDLVVNRSTGHHAQINTQYDVPVLKEDSNIASSSHDVDFNVNSVFYIAVEGAEQKATNKNVETNIESAFYNKSDSLDTV